MTGSGDDHSRTRPSSGRGRGSGCDNFSEGQSCMDAWEAGMWERHRPVCPYASPEA